MMKLIVGLFWILSTSFALSAQTVTNTAAASSVTVVKYSWSKERVGWEGDPFSGPIENFDEMRVRARNEKRISDAKRGGNGSEVSRAERDARTDEALISTIHQSPRPRYGFLYKVSVQNNSNKIITSVDWDYVFIDKNAQIEVGRKQFTSVQKISAGKTKDLQFFIPAPPTKTISVTSLNEDERKSLDEYVVVVRVEYSDGTLWQHPPAN
jgi:hypothetical protein